MAVQMHEDLRKQSESMCFQQTLDMVKRPSRLQAFPFLTLAGHREESRSKRIYNHILKSILHIDSMQVSL